MGMLLALLIAVASPPAGARSVEWVWPLDPAPQVVRPFEPPQQPWLFGHRGVDLTGRAGQEVHAAGAGAVTFAGPVAGRSVVVVSHGALRTTYEPVRPIVSVGARVAAGAPIGRLQTVGSHCGVALPCLHWGLLRGATYLDPLALLRTGPVRLLPGADSFLRSQAGAPAATVRSEPTAPASGEPKESSAPPGSLGGGGLVAAVGGLLALAFAARRAA